MSEAMIEVENLRKTFDGITAVDGLSFSVKKGEVLGVLGPNGAGKSTTMKMVTGFLTPDSGSMKICGFDVSEAALAAQEMIGYLPEGAPAYDDMTPAQFLEFIAGVRGYNSPEKETAISAAVAKTQLQSVLDQPIETLSKGFKRRVGLAQAILHDPPVLILDEPTDGLDPNQKFAVRRLISGMAKEKAIIISTHILEEVDAVCTRAVIIDQGQIVLDGTPDELAAKSRYHNAVSLQVPTEQAANVKEALSNVAHVSELQERKSENGVTDFTLFPEEGHRLLEEVAKLTKETEWDVKRLMAEPGRLDEVFRKTTTADAGEEAAS